MMSRRINACIYESPLQQSNANTQIDCYSESMFSWIVTDAGDTYSNTAPANSVAVDWAQATVANQGRWRAPGSAASISDANGNATLDVRSGGDYYEQDNATRMPYDIDTPFDMLFVAKSTSGALGTFPMWQKFDDSGTGRGSYIIMNAATDTINCRFANTTTAAIDVTYPANWGTNTHTFRITYNANTLASGLTAWFDGNLVTATVNQDDSDGTWDNAILAGLGGPDLTVAGNAWIGFWFSYWSRSQSGVTPGIPGPEDLGTEIMARLQRYYQARYAIRS